MTHYRLSGSMPSAIILARNPRTSSLDELKTYKGTDIFLNDGNEFQIKLFNPLQEKIGVSISINGKKPNHLLVLNPGEESIIDRFVDERRKMVFGTYQYDSNNSAAKKAVEYNGLIDIKFFKEYTPPVIHNTWITTNTPIPYYGISGTGTAINPPKWESTRTIDGNYVNMSLTNDTIGTVYSNFSQDLEFKDSKSTKDLKETGIVSKGNESNQNFQSVNVSFEPFPFYTLTYKLKPMSEKKSYDVDVREYCTNCGYRLRNNKWQYCPKCGSKI